MSRDEYFDIKQNGWDGKNNMNAKWFAESYDDAFANKINSPGKKLYDSADATAKARVDAEANKIRTDFETQKARAICK